METILRYSTVDTGLESPTFPQRMGKNNTLPNESFTGITFVTICKWNNLKYILHA